MNTLNNIAVAVTAAAILLLAGCATTPEQTARVVSSQQILAAVSQGEEQVKSQQPHSTQYRWINTSFSDMGAVYGWVYHASATVPANMPRVGKSAIVIIRMPDLSQEVAYPEHYATVTTLVCNGQDIACGKRIGSAIDNGKLPGFGKPLTPAQVQLATSIGAHGIKTAEAAE